MGFIFEKGIGIKDFFTPNVTKYCTEFVYVARASPGVLFLL